MKSMRQHAADVQSMSSKPDFAAVRLSASELSMIREVYAETYPVRPLLNHIDELEAELAAIKAADWRS